ncbi:DedA family protein [Sphingomonas sp. ASV193]|uniref:DedA family protein n=1 Tax=Sphingomonas sp. ASV193 TaxID=3144405 RepID=UPI0032E88672
MSGLHHLIHQYGHLGVFLVAFVEGEFGPLVGGALAKLGKLNPVLVVLLSWAGAFLSTTMLFFLGRWRRESKIVHKVTDKRAFALALKWIDRHPRLFCFGYRFVYGMRIVGPITISLSHVPWRVFVLLNLLNGIVWAVILTAFGWFVGPHLARAVASWFTPERFTIASVVALGALLIVIAHRAERSAAKKRAAAIEADQASQSAAPISPASTAD